MTPVPTSVAAAQLLERARGAVDLPLLQEIAAVVLAEPTPSGAEALAADRLAAWGRGEAPALTWALQPLTAGRANLLCCPVGTDWQQPGGVWCYTHLDHSLSGQAQLDVELTGWPDEPTPPVIDGNGLRALGLAVSRGPAICALAAVIALATAAAEVGDSLPIGLLLAAGGTHRAPAPTPLRQPIPAPGLEIGLGLGVAAALATSWRPHSVLNVKGGAAGVLSAEPGCLLIQITWRGRFTALPARASGGGAAVVAARLVLGVEEWRSQYRAQSDAGQLAGDLCVGSVSSGLSYKTDLQPGYASIGVYLSTVAGTRPEAVAAELERHLIERLSSAAMAGEGVLSVRPYAGHDAAATAEDAPVVTAGRRAWERRFGNGTSHVRGYRGSTDGVLFRRAGVPTARFGPTARTSAADPTVEELSWDEVTTFVDMYLETLVATTAALKGHRDDKP